MQFALIWWLTITTGSAAVLAAATFVGLFPQIALGPFIGALVDRWNRKLIMFVSDALVAAASVPVALIFFLGEPAVELVLLTLFIRALGAAFHAPAMVASTSLMVPSRHLTRIQGLNQGLQGGLIIITAPLGALLVTLLPMAGVVLIDLVSALFALVPLVFIRVPQPAPQSMQQGSRLASLLRDTGSGLAYLRRHTGHLGLVGMGALINLTLVPAFALLPILVSDVLHGTAMHLGWLNVALGIGMLAGGILLGAWGGFKSRILTTLSALACLGLAILLLALPGSSLSLALAAMLLVGGLAPLVNGPIQAILQATVDPGYQGRVFSLIGSLAGATAPLGLLIAAPVADVLGIRTWYLLAGLSCLAVALAASLTPAILRVERTAQSTPVPPGTGPATGPEASQA